MKIYRIERDTIKETAMSDIREVEVKETPGGFKTRSNRRVSEIDNPDIKIRIIVYSKSNSTKKIDRLCEKIRKAIDEYNGGKNEKKC